MQQGGLSAARPAALNSPAVSMVLVGAGLLGLAMVRRRG